MKLHVEFSDISEDIDVELQDNGHDISVSFGKLQTASGNGGEPYEGEYVMTPKIYEQMMPTKNKVLRKDVTIKAIPYVESDNVAGGKTVRIG